MKIMIVEDDQVALARFEKHLAQTEAGLITAFSGTEAWDQFVKHRPRIVVLDWLLPEISGFDLCQRMRGHALDTYTYVIIMTANDNTKDVLAAFEAGADDYVAKSCDVRELHARMNTGKRIIQLEDKHRSMHRTLANSRNKFRTVLDALPEEIITVNQEMKIISMNKSALSARSGTFQTHIDKPCCTLSEDSQITYGKSMHDLVRKVFATQKMSLSIDRFDDKKGNAVVKQRTALPVTDETGRVMTVTVVSRDVTESHQRDEEIKSLNEKLKKISSELIKKNVKLEKTLGNLERTQAQMLHSEKIASIGQLAAGVAHEINNPIGFVSSNLKTLGDYQQDFSRLIGQYHKLKATLRDLPDGQLPQRVSEHLSQVETTEADVDIDYLMQDVDELVGDCCEGTERIKKIVDDLKHFAHPGENKKKETDINVGIESTLNVIKNELKYKATIIKDLGALPIIQAYPQQLNQVFMNILVNAAQAIEKTGEIHIATATVDGMAEIRISDTGCGISEDNLSKIFDPFFTTKDVGKGTGLGMNIAYNIINKHDGDIRVESELGKGTTFIIRLPAPLQ